MADARSIGHHRFRANDPRAICRRDAARPQLFVTRYRLASPLRLEAGRSDVLPRRAGFLPQRYRDILAEFRNLVETTSLENQACGGRCSSCVSC